MDAQVEDASGVHRVIYRSDLRHMFLLTAHSVIITGCVDVSTYSAQ